jgi:RNA exonuclease 1
MEDYDSKVKEREEKEKGRLTKERVKSFIHDEETLKRFGYLLEAPEGKGGDIPNEVGQKRTCDRCKLEYVVKDKGDLSQVSSPSLSYLGQ